MLEELFGNLATRGSNMNGLTKFGIWACISLAITLETLLDFDVSLAGVEFVDDTYCGIFLDGVIGVEIDKLLLGPGVKGERFLEELDMFDD